MIDKDKFKNPDSIYRSAPFWSLNDFLRKEELSRQINAFYEQGMGGVFLHPRGGMLTEYLSEDFFDCIAACLETLEERGMVAWLYDEDRFPSGNAAGKVVKSNPDFAMKCLVLSDAGTDDIEIADGVIAFYAFGEESFKRIPAGSAEKGKIIAVSAASTYKNPVFDYEGMVDVCSKEAIDVFIDKTHNQYYQRFEKYFGNVIEAIFTDEPHFHTNRKDSLPWPNGFQHIFCKKYGYDLTDFLPCLFIDKGD